MEEDLEDANIQLTQSEEGYECVKCHSKPDDVLIMTCEHNLCLDCAIKVMQVEIMRSSQMPNVKLYIVFKM